MKLPHEPEAERALLACLCGPCSEEHRALLGGLHEGDFVVPANRTLFRAAAELQKRGHELSAPALKAELSATGTLHEVGGWSGLVDMLSAEDVGNPSQLAEILKAKRRLRQIINVGTELVRAAENESDTPEVLIHLASQDLHRIAVESTALESGSWETILDRIQDGAAFRIGKSERAAWTGIGNLDDICRIPAGEVTVLAARPGVGKTALMMQIACESAKRGAKPYIMSLELPRPNAEARIAAYFGGSNIGIWRKGEYSEREVKRIWDAQPWLKKGQLACPPVGIPWGKLEAEIRRSVEVNGTDLVLIDYFGLIGKGTVAKNSSEAYAYSALSQSITALAKDLKIGMVLLCQLTKASEAKPTLKDLADSDRPARDAAVTVLLWHDAQGKPQGELVKNRDGRLGWKRELELRDGVRFIEVEHETATASGGWT